MKSPQHQKSTNSNRMYVIFTGMRSFIHSLE